MEKELREIVQPQPEWGVLFILAPGRNWRSFAFSIVWRSFLTGWDADVCAPRVGVDLLVGKRKKRRRGGGERCGSTAWMFGASVDVWVRCMQM